MALCPPGCAPMNLVTSATLRSGRARVIISNTLCQHIRSLRQLSRRDLRSEQGVSPSMSNWQLQLAASSRQQAAGSRQQAADALNAHRLWATSHSESGVQCRRICASPRKIKSAHQLMQSAQADMLIWGFGRHAVGPGTACTAVCPAVRVGERTGQSTGKLDARVTLHKYSGHGTL